MVLTTGRPLQAIGTFLEELDLLGENQYSITFNGGLVHKIQVGFWIRLASLLKMCAPSVV